MAAERRRYVRQKGPFDGTWQGAVGRRDARIVDLSLGGCFIDVVTPGHPGDLIKVEIRGPNGPVTLNGQIVYVDRVQGFAVVFTDNNPADLDRLRQILVGMAS